MKSIGLRVAVVALAIFALPGWASAQFSGNLVESGSTSVTTGPSNADPTTIVNYAVLTNPTSALSQSFLNTLGSQGFGSQTLAQAENDKYVYIYQLTTNDPNGVSAFYAAMAKTSIGYATSSNSGQGGYVLTGSEYGAVVSNDTSLSATNTANGVTQETGALNSIFPKYDNSNFPGGATGPGLENDFGGWASAIPAYSAIMVVFSNLGPGLGGVEITDTEDGTSYPPSGGVPVPSATPEPGTFALLALGLPAFGFGYVRRLRQRLSQRVAPVAV